MHFLPAMTYRPVMGMNCSLLRSSLLSSGLLGGLLGRRLLGGFLGRRLLGDCLLHGGLLCRGGSSRGGGSRSRGSSLFGRCGFLDGSGVRYAVSLANPGP